MHDHRSELEEQEEGDRPSLWFAREKGAIKGPQNSTFPTKIGLLYFAKFCPAQRLVLYGVAGNFETHLEREGTGRADRLPAFHP